MAVNVTIGGDFCVTPPYVSRDLFSEGLLSFFRNSDINIVNLECPVINEERNSKIIKTGPHLYTNIDIVKQLKRIKIHAVTLANNHILDYGEKGLKNTLQVCKDNNISVVGAGKCLVDAGKPTIIESKGLRIALVNFCENEWSVATNISAGANPLDIIENFRQIKYAKGNADFVITIIHGGHEYFNLPSPRMVKLYRFFAENGADAVIGHHIHCFSGYELHNNVPIIYSLGNMLFTRSNNHTQFYTGLLARLRFEKDTTVQFDFFPVKQSEKDFRLNLLTNDSKRKIIQEIDTYSGIIKQEKELDRHWKYFADSKKRTLNVFSPIRFVPVRYIRTVLYRLGLNKLFLRKRNVANMLNHIRCESHRDIIISLLKSELNNI